MNKLKAFQTMNKKYLFTALFALLLGGNLFSAVAQNNDTKPVDEKYLENDVVSLAGKEGFTFRTASSNPMVWCRLLPPSITSMIRG